ncbi:MAG TPA: hypothetical protein VFB34_00225 [Chloroflexota bacterium]|nr:hypothetical protein [Chloroflexota bacterium]
MGRQDVKPPQVMEPAGEQRQAKAEWGGISKHESPWYPSLAALAALVLWLLLPERFTLPGAYSWIVPVLEGCLLVPLILTRLMAGYRGGSIPRVLSICLIALINIANLISLVELLQHLLNHGKISGQSLLLSAAFIWVTNVIVFALWYWELDRGGPYLRRTVRHRQPDFLFPQMSSPYCAPEDWNPDFIDYFYVSFTNATAFSPTDTMPLTNWAKLLMTVQSFASLVTVGLVAARAVNILK